MTAKEFILDSKPQWEKAIVEQDRVGHCITISYASLTDCHDEDASHESLMARIADLGAEGRELAAATDAVSPPNAACAAMPSNDCMTRRAASWRNSRFASNRNTGSRALSCLAVRRASTVCEATHEILRHTHFGRR